MELICILCPKGCKMEVTAGNISGNSCPRGKKYATDEFENPVRTLTTTIKVKNNALLSVKSDKPLPKGKMMECMQTINKASISSSVSIGDIIVKNIYSDINIVATKNLV